MTLLGQTKVALKEDGFLAAFIDFSKAYDRVVGVLEGVWCERKVSINASQSK